MGKPSARSAVLKSDDGFLSYMMSRANGRTAQHWLPTTSVSGIPGSWVQMETRFAKALVALQYTLTSRGSFTFKYGLDGGSLEHGLMVFPDSLKLLRVDPVDFEPRSKRK